MEFCALGPIAVHRDGIDIDLGAPKQRAVLALMLVHRNTSLAADQILDHLWGGDADGKLNALRVHVSRLRDALDPERIRGEGSCSKRSVRGYRLDVDDDHFDVARFEGLVAAGRTLLRADPAGAAASLRTALDLWRGSPYEDFVYDEFVQTEVDRLSEIRIDAIEDRIEADLAAGLAGELVSELEVLRQQHPLRERLAAHQALALYRSGRPAEALRAIDRFRRRLGEELGIDPSPRVLRLEEQILLHDDRVQPQLPSADTLLGPTRAASNPFKGLRPLRSGRRRIVLRSRRVDDRRAGKPRHPARRRRGRPTTSSPRSSSEIPSHTRSIPPTGGPSRDRHRSRSLSGSTEEPAKMN